MLFLLHILLVYRSLISWLRYMTPLVLTRNCGTPDLCILILFSVFHYCTSVYCHLQLLYKVAAYWIMTSLIHVPACLCCTYMAPIPVWRSVYRVGIFTCLWTRKHHICSLPAHVRIVIVFDFIISMIIVIIEIILMIVIRIILVYFLRNTMIDDDDGIHKDDTTEDDSLWPPAAAALEDNFPAVSRQSSFRMLRISWLWSSWWWWWCWSWWWWTIIIITRP